MVIGDSITEHNFRTMYNYHDYIAKELGITVINCGISGSGYKVHDIDDAYDANIPPFYKRIQGYAEAGYNPDVITIFGGINDLMFSGKNMGEITDTTADTWFGAAYMLVENIKQYFPNVPYAIMSPLPAYAMNTSGVYADFNPSDKTNKEYIFVQKMEEFCDYYSIPFLNQYNKTGFRPWEEAFRERFTKYRTTALADGLHPNADGHRLIYPKIREFLKTLI